MTVIVATRTTMYSDSKVTQDEGGFPASKIFRHQGALVGVAGKTRSIEKFYRWFVKGSKGMLDFNEAEEGGDSFSVIVLNKRGIWFYDDCSLPDLVDREYHGCGVGWPPAQAALLLATRLGEPLDPRGAIEIACEVSPNSCGLPVREFSLAH